MLVQLAIRDIVLIDRLELDLGEGLSVLTGETGAGKSILLDAFSLALGGRGDGGLVRHGMAQGQVTAVFHVAAGHPVQALIAENSLPDEETLILRRVQMADGRTRAFVNDQAVSVQVLRAIGSTLVEIHGQHDDRALTDPASHRILLDAFGDLQRLAQDVAARHAAWRRSGQEAAQFRSRIDKARAEGDFLRHAAEELATLAVLPGEEASLAERRALMMQAEKISVDLKEAHDTLTGPDSALSSMAAIIRRLERRGAQAPRLVEPAIAALDQAINAAEEARMALESALSEADFEPADLERSEERLFALRAASRKYDVPVDGLAELAERYRQDIADLDEGEGHLGALEEAAREARRAYEVAAQSLSGKRQKAAQRLDEAVNRELAPLKLERARFTTQVQSDPTHGSADGFDRVEFWVRTNPGTKPGPMMKVASGGELSRLMLALKVVLANKGSAPTLIFDEIDTGVGGAVADAIGLRIARLATKAQVVSVTHAPQVAARAATHFLISKQTVGKVGREVERVATRVTRLDAGLRREEIARMLAGARITDEARAAADRLLQTAE